MAGSGATTNTKAGAKSGLSSCYSYDESVSRDIGTEGLSFKIKSGEEIMPGDFITISKDEK
jgi:hypothetical protein